jgi:Ca-activated chloride channel family protein
LGSEADPRALTSDFFNLNASADLDEDTLKKMADMTGGQYFRATDTESLNAIYRKINELETVHHEEATIRPQKDYYSWCVGVALLLAFYWLSLKAQVLAKGLAFLQSRDEVPGYDQ